MKQATSTPVKKKDAPHSMSEILEGTCDIWEDLSWHPVDGMEICKRLTGGRILLAEPVNYPETDGITLFCEDKNGKCFIVDFGSDLAYYDPDCECFYLRTTSDEILNTEGGSTQND